MKTLVSTFALALALAFTGPAFAGDVTTAKNQADCEKAGGSGMLRPKCAQRRRCNPASFAISATEGARFGGRPFVILQLPELSSVDGVSNIRLDWLNSPARPSWVGPRRHWTRAPLGGAFVFCGYGDRPGHQACHQDALIGAA